MTILDKIIAEKKIEVAKAKEEKKISEFEKSIYFQKNPYSLKKNLAASEIGIITEFKRKSPSKGWIFADANPTEIVPSYFENGALGVSILTDEPFFGGKNQDIIDVRPLVPLPILRKEFIIDEFQLYEAKSLGADVILLIAAALSKNEIVTLSKKAKELQLEVLLEIHNESELESVNPNIDFVGVNNRNLKTFEVDIAISVELCPLIPDEFIKISESGISSAKTVTELSNIGYKGFLMGENFMKEKNPGMALHNFLEEIKKQ
jgi:indole-3-glycerol phosphate synthase